MVWTDADDKRIADIDPISADDIIHEVPRLNSVADVRKLANILSELCKRTHIESRTYYETAAIIRDLGIVIGSIRRHGSNPIELVSELEPILLKAGNLTDLPPRDILMHYTIWNPSGSRLRTYTTHEQEPHLIESIKISLPAIRNATRELFQLRDIDLRDKKALRTANRIGRWLKVFLSGLNHAMRNVTPEAFITHFRPFFEPIVVDNHELRGPGAVTMPLHIFDFLLWGSTESNEQYQRFTSDYFPYNTSEFRQYYLRTRNTKSFLDRLEAEANTGVQSNALQPLLRSVSIWFKRIHGFRGTHLSYAIGAYHGSTVHSFQTGSGGHTTSDLDLIAKLTDHHAARLIKLSAKEN